MNGTSFRLALRLQRFELWAAVLAVAVVSVTALLVRARLEGVGAPVECLTPWLFPQIEFDASRCDRLAGAFLQIKREEAQLVFNTMNVLPLAAGMMLGVGLVSREVEGGTAATMWAMAGSRQRWLLGRLIPVLAVLVATLAVAAIASELLATTSRPWLLGRPAFDEVGMHGPGVVARGLAAFGLSLMVGAWSGKLLPTVILSTLLALFLAGGGWLLFASWTDANAHDIVVPSWFNGEYDGGKFVASYYVLPDGTRIDEGITDVSAYAPAGKDPAAWMENEVQRVAVGVVSSDYGNWLVTELAAFGAIALAGIVSAFAIVERRRPF